MESSSFLLAAVLALYMLPTALAAIKCYECTNTPGYERSSPCDGENAKSITCDSVLYDRCMTFTGTMTVPGHASLDIKLKNCSNSLFCNPGSIFNVCNLFNISTGMISKCNIDCCEGNYCNTVVGISTSVTSFILVLLAMFLNLFPRA